MTATDPVPATTAADLQRGTLGVLVTSNVLGGVAVASGFAVAGLLTSNVADGFVHAPAT